jgi:hypothetical protein
MTIKNTGLWRPRVLAEFDNVHYVIYQNKYSSLIIKSETLCEIKFFPIGEDHSLHSFNNGTTKQHSSR